MLDQCLIDLKSEVILRAAKALERDSNPQWDDEQFETWWNYDSFFTRQVRTWNHFQGTEKERRIHEATIVLEEILKCLSERPL